MGDEEVKKLILRIQGSTDPAAEAQLFALYDLPIKRKIFYHLGTENPDSLDLIGDIRMAILMALRQGNFDVNKGFPLGSYIYGIVRNHLNDYFRKGKRIITTTLDSCQNLSSSSLEIDLEKKELYDEIKKYLSGLEIKLQEVLYLKFFEGLSIPEISKKIKLPPQKVSERIHYALRILKKKCKTKKFLSIFWSILLII